MPIQFVPEPGMVLLCDYDTGFRPPEMVKLRHCIVTSSKFQNKQGLCIVVPVSSVEPKPFLAYHFLFGANAYPFFKPDRSHWAKCDLISHVGFARLDRLLLNGQRATPKISDAHLTGVRHCVLSAAGLHALKPQSPPH
ncbi:MAG: hypothetical protein EXQ92_03200 [Alphaproteobacteria bacterium]|nr:hypothetical protein [Alphaproteobacteria bacterium]